MTLHYHVTPITPRQLLLDDLAGAHFLVSHWEPRDVEVCHQVGQSVMLDNGAFSAWQSGAPISDWSDYYAWCDRWLDCPTTWAVIPDVITGDEDDNSRLVRAWPHGRERSAPVWHMHESLHRLVGLIDTFPRVCVGSSAEFAELLTPHWERRMDEAWRTVERVFKRTPYLHMLRGLQLVRHRWPFASVDSSDIARNHKRNLSRDGGGAARMRARWDAKQTPHRYVDPGEQLALVA